MIVKKIIRIAVPTLLGSFALLLCIAAFLPYPSLKTLSGLLVQDGNFKSLDQSNAIIFKIYLGAIGLISISCLLIIITGRVPKIFTWFQQYISDTKTFFKSIKLTNFDMFSLGVMLLVLGSAVILRLIHIYDQISHDEGYTYTVFSSTSLFNIITNYHLPNNHVFNSLLIYFSTHLFGIQPWVIRLPSLLAGILLIPSVSILANQVYDKHTALLSSILVAIIPGAILYSTIARGYSLVSFFTVVALIMACYVWNHKNLFAWSLLVLFCAFGFYSNPVMLFPFGIIFAWLFFENLVSHPEAYKSKQKFLKYWLLSGFSTAIIVLILYTPIFIYSGVDKVFANQWVSPQPWAGYLKSFPSQIPNIWQEWTTGLQSAWKIVLIIGFTLSLVLHQRISRFHFPLQIAAFIWITFLVIVQRPEQAPKAWAFLQALFAMWCAAGIIGLFKLISKKLPLRVSLSGIVVCIAVMIISIGAIKLAPTVQNRWADKGPVENTIIAIKSQIDTSDLIIIDTPYDAASWYYAALYGIPSRSFNRTLSFQNLYVIVDTQDGQTLQSVLKSRGPDSNQIDLDNPNKVISYGYLDTYLVPHR